MKKNNLLSIPLILLLFLSGCSSHNTKISDINDIYKNMEETEATDISTAPELEIAVSGDALLGIDASAVAGSRVKRVFFNGISTDCLSGDGNFVSIPSGLTVDATIIDGSTNPTTGKAIYDAFELKQDDLGLTGTMAASTLGASLITAIDASAARTLIGAEPADSTIVKEADAGTIFLAPNGDGSNLTGISGTFSATERTTAPSAGDMEDNTFAIDTVNDMAYVQSASGLSSWAITFTENPDNTLAYLIGTETNGDSLSVGTGTLTATGTIINTTDHNSNASSAFAGFTDNNYISIASSNIDSSVGSFSTWFKYSTGSINEYAHYFHYDTDTTTDSIFKCLMFGNSTTSSCEFNNIGYTFSHSNLLDQSWHHIAFTWNYTTNVIEMFVDNVSVGTNTLSTAAPTLTAGTLYIGNRSSGDRPLLGVTLDNIYITNDTTYLGWEE